MGGIRIGVSGWDYDDWRHDFFPEGLRKADRLSYVAEHFDTAEVNGTFYSLVKPRTFRNWYHAVPDDFCFAVKGSRFITHNKKLLDAESSLANFLASGVLELDDKLGPLLWQLPGNLRFDAARVDRFLAALPGDTHTAAELAGEHDGRITDVAYGTGDNHRLRHVLEVRHESWLCDEMARIARRHGVALAFSHAADWPYLEEVTAGFVYLRLHGPEEVYASPYGDTALDRWCRRVQRWQDSREPDDAVRISDRRPPPRKERDVYVYFDNDQGGHAPREAARLRDLLR